MHIPDGFLDPVTASVTYAVFLAYLAYALRRIRSLGLHEPNAIALNSVLAAGIFAAQMLNWPLPGGTSLHFAGGALAGILLGPWLGFMALFLVLLVQCLAFHDGGITALGANVLNMAIIDVLVGYAIYRAFVKSFGRRRGVSCAAAFIGGWLGITLAGIACGLEIGFSPSFPYGVAITVPVMGFWHALLGVIEGIATSLVVAYVLTKSPYLVLSERT